MTPAPAPLPPQERASWEDLAAAWTRWARAPDLDDDFWAWHLEAFLRLLPAPRALTVDVACGEGRLPRVLAGRGHRVLGLDRSRSMVRGALDAGTAAVVADAAALPLADASADLVLQFCCLQDLDDVTGAVGEAARCCAPATPARGRRASCTSGLDGAEADRLGARRRCHRP